MKRLKSVYNGGMLISQYARETEHQKSTNDYVKCFHIDTSFFKTKTIRLQNLDTGVVVLSYKILGYVDGLGNDPDTIIEDEIVAGTTTNILDAAEFLQYSKIELYVKSKVDDTPADYVWEYFATSF
jgi:hypothetical protein